MRTISLLYIDDLPDLGLAEYLREFARRLNDGKVGEFQNIHFEAHDIKFDSSEDSFEKLLNSQELKSADIVILDHQLFSHCSGGRILTGGTVAVLLRALMPFTRVFVITQFDYIESSRVLRKYNSSEEPSGNETRYYDDKLSGKLKQQIEAILEDGDLAVDLKETSGVDSALAERVALMVSGENRYADLNPLDVDELIQEFRRFESRIEKHGS